MSHAKNLLTILHLTERQKSSLGLRQLDLNAGTLRVEPGTTKKDEVRVAYLTPELKLLLTAQVERVRMLERQTG